MADNVQGLPVFLQPPGFDLLGHRSQPAAQFGTQNGKALTRKSNCEHSMGFGPQRDQVAEAGCRAVSAVDQQEQGTRANVLHMPKVRPAAEVSGRAAEGPICRYRKRSYSIPQCGLQNRRQAQRVRTGQAR